jgi:hypothetical protein
VFEHSEGKQVSPAQRAALRRGLRAHRTFASEASCQVASDEQRVGRCFIATHVFGEGPETRDLRRFRDQVLRPWPTGRRLILVYYRLAPAVCRAMRRWPMTGVVTRWTMLPVAWLVQRFLAGQEATRGH